MQLITNPLAYFGEWCSVGFISGRGDGWVGRKLSN